MRETNAALEAIAQALFQVVVLSIFDPLRAKDGRPRPEKAWMKPCAVSPMRWGSNWGGCRRVGLLKGFADAAMEVMTYPQVRQSRA